MQQTQRKYVPTQISSIKTPVILLRSVTIGMRRQGPLLGPAPENQVAMAAPKGSGPSEERRVSSETGEHCHRCACCLHEEGGEQILRYQARAPRFRHR